MLKLRVFIAKVLGVLNGSITSQIETGPTLTNIHCPQCWEPGFITKYPDTHFVKSFISSVRDSVSRNITATQLLQSMSYTIMYIRIWCNIYMCEGNTCGEDIVVYRCDTTNLLILTRSRGGGQRRQWVHHRRLFFHVNHLKVNQGR